MPQVIEWVEDGLTPAEMVYIKRDLLYLYLAGYTRPTQLAEKLGVSKATRPGAVAWITRHINTAGFVIEVETAQRDLIGSAIERIKSAVHRFVENVEKLADEAEDERVKLAANKDLLDRAGTGATSKIQLTTPTEYMKAVQRFIKAEDGDKS